MNQAYPLCIKSENMYNLCKYCSTSLTFPECKNLISLSIYPSIYTSTLSSFRSLGNLDANKKGKYVIEVHVSDNGGLTSTSEVVVSIPFLHTPNKDNL